MNMKATLFAALLLASAASVSQAQTTTRVTPCDAATPNDAICVVFAPPTTDSNGAALTKPLTYRIARKLGTGTFTTLSTTILSPQYYDKGLAPGTYTYVVYANCSPNCSESNASNTASRDATVPITTPNPPVIQVVQVTISDDRAPVYRVIGSTDRYTRGEYFGSVPVGRECSGPVLFRYRGKSFRFVHVEPTELWGTTDATRLAAPCA